MSDTPFWNMYYKSHGCGTDDASLFAKAMFEKYMRSGDKLIDLGCGNGRDSLYFAEKGLSVIGIDFSNVAIDGLNTAYSQKNVVFKCEDFVSLDGIENNSIDFCYSRFTIHAIDVDKEKELLRNVKRVLRSGGRMFIEARSIHDEIYGLGEKKGEDEYFYEGHYRRFIDMKKIIPNIYSAGFEIIYAEESDLFAPYKGKNPVCIRMVLKS